jgi:predicted molibdopterin-dependent oxidoreductase YjgC
MATPSKDRLTQPLVRENGGHRAASWDEALDRVTQAFRRTIDKHDPRSFGMFSYSKNTKKLN